MRFFGTNQIKFDKDYLNELTSESNSGVFKQKCDYHIALHPAQWNDFGQSIKDELSKKIARFDERFKGIMLGYENLTLQSELGVIGPDNCFIHMDVQALFFVFRPEIGMILKGRVTRTTKDHVGCLVYNTFNISISKPEDERDGMWLGHNVTVNSEVEFKIIYVNLNARLPHIRGELRSVILTEGVSTDGEMSPTKSKKKKKKKDGFNINDVEIKEEKTAEEGVVMPNRRIRFSSIDDDEPTDRNEIMETSNRLATDEETAKKKKKKAKKDKHKRRKGEDLDVSLESLDLRSLFSDSAIDFDATPSESQTLADGLDRKSKKRRRKSVSEDILLDKVKLEADSDLEKMLSAT